VKFASKKELLESIQAEHETFVTLAGNIPQRRYKEEGVWGDGWTIKDLFAHLTEWHEMFLGWHRQGLAGEDPVMPADGYKWNQTPALNHAIQRRHKNKSRKKVRAEFDESYEEILSLAKKLTEKQLLTPGYFPWTKKHPLTSYLAPNTCMHYRTATKILKRWLRQRGE
jgi:hypothetical protein